MIACGASGLALPNTAFAFSPKEITWDDLIPPGVPYSEIIGEGEVDEVNDRWLPVFDSNATKMNPALNGAYIKMPGFIIPIETTSAGVTEFILVPYVGACLHTPPPPANQLVFVKSKEPWPDDDLFAAVWVTGFMTHELMSTDIAEIGYNMDADAMEIYVW